MTNLRDNVQHLQDETIRVLKTQKGELVSAEVAAKVNGKKLENIEAMIAGDLVRYDTVTSVAQTVPVEPKASKWAELLKVGGKSIVFNQLMPRLDMGFYSAGWNHPYFGSYSVSGDNEITLSGLSATGSGSVTAARIDQRMTLKAGHTYFASFEIKPPVANRARMFFSGAWSAFQSIAANVWTRISAVVVSPGTSAEVGFYVNVDGAMEESDTVMVRNPMLVDLTQAILDFTADGFISAFPLPYYEKNQGEIISAEVAELESKGRNLFNDSVESVPAYSGTTIGAKRSFAASTATTCYKSSFYVQQGVSYRISWATPTQSAANSVRVSSIIDSNETIVGTFASYDARLSARQISFVATASGWVDFCVDKYAQSVQVERGTTATDYTPYREVHHPLPERLLAEYPWLAWSAGDAHNEMRWNADLKRWEGVKRVNRTDLGNLYWMDELSSGGTHRLAATIPDIKYTQNYLVVGNILCAKLTPDIPNNVASHITDNTISGHPDRHIVWASCAAYQTNPGGFAGFVQGQFLYYEMATEEIIDLTPVMQDFDRFIETEQGGTVAFVQKSGFKLPVENTIKWCIDLES